MKCIVAALASLLLATSFTQASVPTAEPEIAKAEKAMRERLKDFSDVKLTHVVYVADSRAVCARFTAKDGDVYYFGTLAFDVDGKVFERRYLYIDESHADLKSGDVEMNADAIYLLCRTALSKFERRGARTLTAGPHGLFKSAAASGCGKIQLIRGSGRLAQGSGFHVAESRCSDHSIFANRMGIESSSSCLRADLPRSSLSDTKQSKRRARNETDLLCLRLRLRRKIRDRSKRYCSKLGTQCFPKSIPSRPHLYPSIQRIEMRCASDNQLANPFLRISPWCPSS